VLYHFLVPLARNFRIFNVFSYISLRAVGAAATALILAFVLGPIIMRILRRQAFHQVVREGTPDSHAGKGTTPTMGGLIILASALISSLIWGRFSLSRPYMWIAIFVTIWMGVIGLLDDILKLRQKRAGQKNQGLIERYKLAGQLVVGLALGWFLWQHPLSANLPGASTTLPFFKYYLVVPIAGFAWTYVVFTTFILTGTSNAVNITDGLDGLAAGLSTEPGSTRCSAWRWPARWSASSGSTRIRPRSSWETPARSRSVERSARWRFCSSPSSCSRWSASCSPPRRCP
jgi:phospho-N-acetylmuramoyl-pentapeptide-transferase